MIVHVSKGHVTQKNMEELQTDRTYQGHGLKSLCRYKPLQIWVLLTGQEQKTVDFEMDRL